MKKSRDERAICEAEMCSRTQLLLKHTRQHSSPRNSDRYFRKSQ
jgi:hypothetical protein